MAKDPKRQPKGMNQLSGAKVTKRQPKGMKQLSRAKVIKERTPVTKTKNRTPEAKIRRVFRWTKAMKRVLVRDGVYRVTYVARDNKGEKEMRDHYENIMVPWLKKNEVTEVRCWIARHGDLRSLTIEVDEYVGEWNEIEGIQELYRSDSEGVLMEALLLAEGSIGK